MFIYMMNVAEINLTELFFFKTKHSAAAWDYQVCWSKLGISV